MDEDYRAAQGHEKKETVLRLPPIRQLKAELRQAVWNETVKDVVKVSHERRVIRRLKNSWRSRIGQFEDLDLNAHQRTMDLRVRRTRVREVK